MNNLFDEFNNINDHSTAKKPINDDCSPLSEEVELSCVDDKLKVVNMVSITKCTKYIFSKSYTEKWSREIFVIHSILKTNPWTNKIKDLNREKIIISFYEKKLLLSKA